MEIKSSQDCFIFRGRFCIPCFPVFILTLSPGCGIHGDMCCRWPYVLSVMRINQPKLLWNQAKGFINRHLCARVLMYYFSIGSLMGSLFLSESDLFLCVLPLGMQTFDNEILHYTLCVYLMISAGFCDSGVYATGTYIYTYKFTWTYEYMYIQSAAAVVQCHYKMISFLTNHHNRYPIACLWGRGMGCVLWVKTQIYVLPVIHMMNITMAPNYLVGQGVGWVEGWVGLRVGMGWGLYLVDTGFHQFTHILQGWFTGTGTVIWFSIFREFSFNIQWCFKSLFVPTVTQSSYIMCLKYCLSLVYHTYFVIEIRLFFMEKKFLQLKLSWWWMIIFSSRDLK